MRYFLVPTIAVSIATFASASVSNAQQQRYYNNGKYVGSSQTRSNQSGTTTQYRGTSGQIYGSNADASDHAIGKQFFLQLEK